MVARGAKTEGGEGGDAAGMGEGERVKKNFQLLSSWRPVGRSGTTGEKKKGYIKHRERKKKTARRRQLATSLGGRSQTKGREKRKVSRLITSHHCRFTSLTWMVLEGQLPARRREGSHAREGGEERFNFFFLVGTHPLFFLFFSFFQQREMSWRASVVHRCDTVKRRCFFFLCVCAICMSLVCRRSG